MAASSNIYAQSFGLFSSIVKKHESFFQPLQDDLRKAHITVPTEHWAAFTIFVAVMTSIPAFIFCLMFAVVGMGFGLSAVLVGICAGLGITAGSFFLAYKYPSLAADERKKKIENALSFSTIYMSTIARSGFPPQEIFRLLGGFTEYGEVAKEARKISSDINVLGLDVSAALNMAAARSPSADWTELLAGLKTTINVGGDLGSFLSEKAKGFVADYRRRLKDFSNMLSLLVEVYITLVVVGVVFFIVTTSVMVAIGGVPVELIKMINYALVLVGMPIITAAFILIIKGISPLEA
ncbi:MAG: type II secretion system F family protein [archaeon]